MNGMFNETERGEIVVVSPYSEYYRDDDGELTNEERQLLVSIVRSLGVD